MPLRRRLALVAAVAVAVAVALACAVSYLVVRGALRGQLDDQLRNQAAVVEQGDGLRGLGGDLPGPGPKAGGRAPFWQIVTADGSVLVGAGGLALPADAPVRAVASGSDQDRLADVEIAGTRVRTLTFHSAVVLAGGQIAPVAIEIARPLGPVDRVLSRLQLVLVLVLLGGIALAAGLARVAASRVIRPLAEVARTAETIGETDDLSLRLRVHAEDEVGQLAKRFNGMLERLEHSRGALDDSVRAQRRLVADASHELRTPVSSLRTNVEVLLLSDELSGEERERLLADMVEQSEELTSLVADLIELARGDEPRMGVEDVRLDGIVAESLARLRRNAPGLVVAERLEPVVVAGVAERLSRAVNNLLDNAARHSAPGGTVEVTVDRGGVRVRDHGEGIAEAELPHVFDRFFRGAAARSSPGSGLGLAIVRQVAEQHGGAIEAANARDGGALFTLRLPGRTTSSPEGEDPGEASPAGSGTEIAPAGIGSSATASLG